VGFTIRRRWSADLPGCGRALAAVHRADGYPVEWPADPAGWLAEPGQLAGWVAVAADGTVAGHVAVGPGTDSSAGPLWAARTGGEPERTAAVGRLFADPAARGHGLGARLLAAAVRQVRHWELTPVLDVVTDNTAAVRLYRSSGWQELDTVQQHWSNGMTVAVHCFALAGATTDQADGRRATTSNRCQCLGPEKESPSASSSSSRSTSSPASDSST
jgi:GNAT superfamily N-acetyltransferase